MDLIHRRAPAWEVFLTALFLTCIGIVMVYGGSPAAAQAQYHDGAFFLKRQMVYASIGLAGRGVPWRGHPAKLGWWTLPLLGMTLLAGIIFLFPHNGRVA